MHTRILTDGVDTRLKPGQATRPPGPHWQLKRVIGFGFDHATALESLETNVNTFLNTKSINQFADNPQFSIQVNEIAPALADQFWRASFVIMYKEEAS
jgi:hypothetical protein